MSQPLQQGNLQAHDNRDSVSDVNEQVHQTPDLDQTGGDGGTTGENPGEAGVARAPALLDDTGETGGGGSVGSSLEPSGTSSVPDYQLPRGFEERPSGIYYRPAGDDGAPFRICSVLRVLAMTRNEHGQDWGRLIELVDPDGKTKRWACPMELLAGDGSEFRRALLSQGLRIESGLKVRILLSQLIQGTHVTARAICTGRQGWHGSSFVLPDETIYAEVGAPREHVVLQMPGEPAQVDQAGTLAEWRDNIGTLCIGNSRLLLAASVAFSAPLLNIVGDDSGGINFVGMSSTGKTTALRVASSVWGGPDYLHRWRATGNGLESIAQAHNDALLVLDELAQVDPREAGEIAYMLANGTGKHRAQRTGVARPAARWRLLFLSAGEIGLADHMLEGGKRARAGQEVRLVDVPAAVKCGLYEALHGFDSGAILSERLNDAVSRYHGVPIRNFLYALVKMPRDELRRQIEKLRSNFVRDIVLAGATGQIYRVAQRFGLIAAGGELATQLDFTGWSPGDAAWAAETCFKAWLDGRDGTGPQEVEAALAQVRYFLELHGDYRFHDLERGEFMRVANRAGYKREVDDQIEYFIFGEVFRNEVCKGFDSKMVARALKARGLLKIQEKDRLTVKAPGGQRAYCVLGDTL